MTSIKGIIPNLVSGVSQQHPTIRHPSQGEKQENCLSSPSRGLVKRPPTYHMGKITSSLISSAFVHIGNQPPYDGWLVMISQEEGLRAFNLFTGSEIPVQFPNGTGYLTASSPRAFKAITVGDMTFILNMEIPAEMTSDTSPTRNPEALVTIKQGVYGRTYKVILNGVEAASYTTPDGGVASDAQKIDTTHIAAQLWSDLQAHQGFTTVQIANTLHIYRQDGADFSIRTVDGFNGHAMSAAKGRVAQFSELPNVGPNGFTVEVTGAPSGQEDNYYVRFEANDGVSGPGVWKETLAPGIKTKFNAATMPHVLEPNLEGGLIFKAVNWTERLVGDDESCPVPSFVGEYIADVFFHRNRLGFLAGENVILSRAGDHTNFWRHTANALLDSDPIDVSAAHPRLALLHHAIPFNGELLVFSDGVQFELSGGDLLTPRTASLKLVSEFEASSKVKPVLAGDRIYFAAPREAASWGRIFELFIDGEEYTVSGITAHVPRYIHSSIFKLAVDPEGGTLIALSDLASETLFMYKYFWDGDQKLQSAWSKWTLSDNPYEEGVSILGAGFIEGTLFMAVSRPDGVSIEAMNVVEEVADSQPEDEIHLDRQVDETKASVSYDANTNKSTITMPYNEQLAIVVVRPGNTAQGLPPGYAPEILSRPTAGSLEVSGDYRDVKFVVGRQYRALYRFSPLLLRKQGENGVLLAVTKGRTYVRTLSLTHGKSGHFEVHVSNLARDKRVYTFTPHTVGNDKIAEVPIEEGVFRVPVRARNTRTIIEVISDSHLPFTLISAEWDGHYSPLP